MFDMTDTPKIYVACLASYNNGVLHGRWIDASSDVDAMQEEVNAILRESKFPNVTVECVDCVGDGWVYTDGSVERETATCETCKGTGTVPSAEEFAIHDFDGLPSTLGEYCSLQEIADYVEFIEACEDMDSANAADLAAAMVENWHSVEDAKEAIDRFCGVFDTFRDYADDAADEMIACHSAGGTVPQALVNYFDYEAWARDLAMEMTVLDIPGGVAVFHE